MTTLIPREPYSPEELERLYPKGLKLQLVQVVSLNPPIALPARSELILASSFVMVCKSSALYVG